MMENPIGFDPSHAVAGGVGGLIRHLLNPGRPLWEAAVSGFVGVGLAVYFTPVVHPFAELYLERWVGKGQIEEAQLTAAVGCLIGTTAPNIIERVIALIRTSTWPKPPV